jgi:hypothetical protein
MDVLREIAVFCPAERRELLHSRVREAADLTDEALVVLRNAAQETPPHDLNLASSWQRICANNSSVEPEVLEGAGEGSNESLVRQLFAILSRTDTDTTQLWDCIRVLSYAIRFNEPGVRRLFSNASINAWA